MGLLIALATVLTVGGVYATWQYSEVSGVTVADTALGLTIATDHVTSSAGTLNKTGEIAFVIDQKATNDYQAVLSPVTGKESITFTWAPADNIGLPETWTDGVVITWTLKYTAGSFNENPILVSNGGTLTATTADTKTFEFTAAMVMSALKVNDDPTTGLVLDTKAKYDDYVDHATKPTITLELTVAAE